MTNQNWYRIVGILLMIGGVAMGSVTFFFGADVIFSEGGRRDLIDSLVLSLQDFAGQHITGVVTLIVFVGAGYFIFKLQPQE